MPNPGQPTEKAPIFLQAFVCHLFGWSVALAVTLCGLSNEGEFSCAGKPWERFSD